ncbi:Two-component response regulator [Caenispirillum salinarum AK4]|uniref:Two-component response regulator n=1 Tax=Caenispirillum salinarum AK4 TaxID=1238182 RepID=K9H6C0_9PROT|nr:response regulator [Caenispirillum salinarum]EKV32604.1 Two-component response regulator [Caenispirillum salinarum AK4]
MFTIQDLRARIPRLRRHAYLLTGNMHSADAAVEACLGALRRGDDGRPTAADDMDLFRSFHMGLLVPTRPVPGPDAACERDPKLADARDRLFGLAPMERRVVALVTVENFSPADAAKILRMDARRLEQLLIEGRRHLSTPRRALRAMIIEDDQLIGLDIAASLEEMGYGDCIHAANSIEAFEAAAGGEPDLIIADVKLSNGDSGVELARRLTGRSNTPVVFVTAFPEIPLADPAVSKDRVLPKPFSTSAFKTMVRRTMTMPAA